MNQLLSVAEARRRLLSNAAPAALDDDELEKIQLHSALGRILAEELRSPLDLPAFSNSSMDGFAVRAADLAAASPALPVRLEVVADIPAGSSYDQVVEPGQAARIMTGAPVPQGADAVVPVELTDHQDYVAGALPPAIVAISQPILDGANVRRVGEDLRRGADLLPLGRRLQVHDIGILAMCGIPQVRVYPRPRVAILSTGDELTEPGQSLEPGKIYESNGVMLAALVERCGALPLSFGTAPDDPDAIRSLLERVWQSRADLILTSAGVSVGAFDYLRAVIEQQGTLDFWRVNMRPGKPLMVGRYRETRLIGLPGNPVSAFIGFDVFVRPLLQRLSGQPDSPTEYLPARLQEDIVSDGRESYLRAIVKRENRTLVARLTGHQGSGNLFSLVQANALLRVPAGVVRLHAGDQVEIRFLAEGQ